MREAYDTESECVVLTDGKLLSPNNGHPWRYLVQYPSGMYSTLPADKLRFFADAPAVRDAEAAVVVAAEAWKEARKDDHLGPRARWSAEALEAALTALHAARQGEAS